MRLLSEAFRDLRAHPGRTLLSAVGLFIGVVAVVGVYTTGAIAQDVFVANAERQTGREVTVSTRIPQSTLRLRDLTATVDALERTITTAGGSYALITHVDAEVASGETTPRPQTIDLVAGQLDRVRRLPVLQGTWLPADGQIFPGGLVVNEAARERYGGIGTGIQVRISDDFPSYEQTVIGVVADGLEGPTLYQSLVVADYYQPGALQPDWSADLFVHGDAVGEPVLRAAIADAGTALGMGDGEIDVQRADTVGGLRGSLHATQRAFLGVAALTLTVAIIGLLNIGLATVRDRTRELTIRRATGATRLHTFSLVLSSSMLVGLLSAGAAIVATLAAVTFAVPHLISDASALRTPAFPYHAALAGLAASIAAALLGGIAPALAATRVDMTQALRE